MGSIAIIMVITIITVAITINNMTIFHIRLVPFSDCADPVRALRGVLKIAGRRYRLKAISAVEEIESEIPAQQDRAGRSRQFPGPKEPTTHE